MQSWNQQRGFSLIEMMTTISVLAVITAISVPSYLSFQQVARVESLAAHLLSVLEVGQSEARFRHRDIYVHYIPSSAESAGCIGLSEKADVANFRCDSDEGLQKIAMEKGAQVQVTEPVATAPSKLFYFSSLTGRPSSNLTITLEHRDTQNKASGVLVRQYLGLKGCSNTVVTGWSACS